MSSVNHVTLLGRLGQDPEVKITQGGDTLVKFSIATSRKKQNGDEVTTWHNCVAFKRTAEVIRDYVKKGDQVHVMGSIDNSSYQDKKSGETKYFSQVLVNNLTLVGGRKDSQGGQAGGAPAANDSAEFDDVPF